MAENQILVKFKPSGEKRLINAINQLHLAQVKLEKGQKAYYNGKPMKYLDYMEEIGTRIKAGKEGRNKCLHRIGMFGGVSFDKQGKIIR